MNWYLALRWWLHHFRHKLGWAPSRLLYVDDFHHLHLECAKCGRITIV